MKSAVRKHSIYINGRKTSISLEDDFWFGLLEIAALKKTTVPAVVARVDGSRKTVNLSSALRMFVFKYLKAGRKRKSSRRRKKR
jgi:predicted DNA-binding ribbon-helix-helix protein